MSYITKERSTMFKDERNRITINKDLFAFASEFRDEYFANDLNWKKLAIHFKHTTSNQRKIIVLMQDSNEGWFEISEMGRTGVWEVEQIQVFDKDGGRDSVLRSTMPDPSNFDIITERKIAPTELIVSANGTSVTLDTNKAVNYEVGFKVMLYSDTDLMFLNNTVYTITNIAGDVVTLDQPFTGYQGKTLRLKFPNYADASPRQKGIYQFVGVTF